MSKPSQFPAPASCVRGWLALAGLALALAAPARAQRPPEGQVSPAPTPVEVGEDEVLKIDTDLVLVDVTVTDAAGKPVRGLRPEDFKLYEDGEERRLAFVNVERRGGAERPVAVVPMPSALHSQLIHSVASHVAAAGRLPLLDALRLTGATPDTDLASGAKVAALLEALALSPAVALPPGPLLLVDARYRSGWTMTVAAALLREAGASAVLPLVVHQLP